MKSFYFTGTKIEVDEYRKNYFNSYPTYGYSTRVCYVADNSDGTFTICIERYGSCDQWITINYG